MASSRELTAEALWKWRSEVALLAGILGVRFSVAYGVCDTALRTCGEIALGAEYARALCATVIPMTIASAMSTARPKPRAVTHSVVRTMRLLDVWADGRVRPSARWAQQARCL